MTGKTFIKSLMLAGIIPFCAFANNDNDRTPEEEKVINLTNNNGNGVDENVLQVPVTATLTPNVLNVQFTGNVPHATVSVQNALTGGTVSQQSMSAMSGTICTVPVSGLSTGFYTVSVTNNLSGESVSGEFEKETKE